MSTFLTERLQNKVGHLFADAQANEGIRHCTHICLWRQDQAEAIVAELGGWTNLCTLVTSKTIVISVSYSSNSSAKLKQFAVWFHNQMATHNPQVRVAEFKPVTL